MIFLFRFYRVTPIEQSTNIEWRNDVKNWASKGRKIIRIIVLPNKETDYNKWVLRVLELNALSGEEIVFISEKDYLKFLNGKQSSDFWIFDESKVIKLFYDDNNDYTYSETITNNLNDYLDLFNVLYKNGTPLIEVLRKTRKNSKIIM